MLSNGLNLHFHCIFPTLSILYLCTVTVFLISSDSLFLYFPAILKYLSSFSLLHPVYSITLLCFHLLFKVMEFTSSLKTLYEVVVLYPSPILGRYCLWPSESASLPSVSHAFWDPGLWNWFPLICRFALDLIRFFLVQNLLIYLYLLLIFERFWGLSVRRSVLLFSFFVLFFFCLFVCDFII